jgi:hypothetical protein
VSLSCLICRSRSRLLLLLLLLKVVLLLLLELLLLVELLLQLLLLLLLLSVIEKVEFKVEQPHEVVPSSSALLSVQPASDLVNLMWSGGEVMMVKSSMGRRRRRRRRRRTRRVNHLPQLKNCCRGDRGRRGFHA